MTKHYTFLINFHLRNLGVYTNHDAPPVAYLKSLSLRKLDLRMKTLHEKRKLFFHQYLNNNKLHFVASFGGEKVSPSKSFSTSPLFTAIVLQMKWDYLSRLQTSSLRYRFPLSFNFSVKLWFNFNLEIFRSTHETSGENVHCCCSFCIHNESLYLVGFTDNLNVYIALQRFFSCLEVFHFFMILIFLKRNILNKFMA